MAMKKCKGCSDERIPEHDMLEGYCMLCVVKKIKENDELKERIEELTKDLDELTGNLDAECRISQMLLANKKKQAKRIKELETAKTIGIQACDLLKDRIEELEDVIEKIRLISGCHQPPWLSSVNVMG